MCSVYVPTSALASPKCHSCYYSLPTLCDYRVVDPIWHAPWPCVYPSKPSVPALLLFLLSYCSLRLQALIFCAKGATLCMHNGPLPQYARQLWLSGHVAAHGCCVRLRQTHIKPYGSRSRWHGNALLRLLVVETTEPSVDWWLGGLNKTITQTHHVFLMFRPRTRITLRPCQLQLLWFQA